ncbi:hypothetical protein ACFW04_013667 [Cataglyphis niger]
METVGFTQINLHHSKGASAVLARSMTVMTTSPGNRGCIRGIAVYGKLFKSPTEPNPKAVIAVKGLKAQLMPEFCSRNVVAIMAVNSAYFPHEERGSLPPGPVVNLVECCQHQYQRGRKLLEYLVATDLEILNRGNISECDSFRKALSTDLCGFPKRHGTDAEALMGSFEKNCPARAVRSNKKVSWTRRAWNKARNTGRPLDWDLYRRAQKTYWDSVVAAKRESWRRFRRSTGSAEI